MSGMESLHKALFAFFLLSLLAGLVVLGVRINGLEARVTELEDWKAAQEEGDLAEDVAEDFGP